MSARPASERRPGITAIVLAGGRASRFGADKLAADLDGLPILVRTIEAVRTVADEVLVVGRDRSMDADPGSVRFLADERPGGGPLVGLATGLGASRAERAIVVGGDMPLLVPGVLRLLLDRLATGTGAQAAILAEHEVPRPLPIAVISRAVLSAAEASLAGGDGSLRGMLARLDVSVVPEADWRALDPSGASLVDVDEPRDLERLRRST